MGDPRRLKRQYDKPKHPWQYKNLGEERGLIEKYGLKNKKEVWKAESKIREYRKQARQLIGIPEEEKEKKEGRFLKKLRKMGLLKEDQKLDQVLSLTTKDYLKRRLQTQAWKKGYGKTPKEARQLIVHGHIKLGDRKTTKPSMIVPQGKENQIEWYGEPVEQAKAKKATEEVIEEAKEEGKIEEEQKEDEEETKKPENTEKEINYEKLMKNTISDIKEEVKEKEINYKKLLEAEKNNKDRKTMKKWIERKIGE